MTTSKMKAEKPLVSVVIPVYNAEKYIIKALDSVLVQDVPCEIILVDDCGSDRSIEKAGSHLESLGFADYRIVTSGKNEGPGGARNLGVRNSQCEYIAFLDSDDVWAPLKLRKQLEVMESRSCLLCCTGRSIIDSEGNEAGAYIGVGESIDLKSILKTNSINLSSVLIRRETALAHPFPTAKDIHEDYVCWLGILKNGGSAAGIDEPLLLYRKSGNQKTGSKLVSAKMHCRSLRLSGIDPVRSALYFVSYTFNGIRKHRGLK